MRSLIVLFFVIISVVTAYERDTAIANGIAEANKEAVNFQDFDQIKNARKDVAGQIINKTIEIIADQTKTKLIQIIDIFG
uniref:SXP/RAL-2 family protein Ani s 5-like cation-binding domain-containing protein n=1 Tax=Caenorhabditis japonica TaxID=281687 RepID=A0A8R1IWU8_CAEJA